MKKRIPLPLLLPLLLLSSCDIEPEPIEYGHDGCHFCQMTIVDQRYGAELVTDKGKVYKFDALECLVHFYENEGLDANTAPLVMATNFKQPQAFIDARKASILRSPQLPSPMGKYLTSFPSESSAKKAQEEYGGTLLSWEELRKNIHQLPNLNEPVR